MSAQVEANSFLSDPYEHNDNGDFYHVLFLDSDTKPNRFLLYAEDDAWSLPYFEFSDLRSDGIAIPRVCERFRSWLGITNDAVYFTGSVDFLGSRFGESRTDPEKLGRVQLLLVEVHGIEPCSIKIPKEAEWKDASFLQIAFPNRERASLRFMVSAIEACLDESGKFLASLSDERYQPGWFEKARDFLTMSAESDGAKVEGRVEQRHMSITSTILKVKTSVGRYYLKSPACGCNETKTTAIISKLFPKHCPDVVGVCEELNCFVSREFDWDTNINTRDAVMLLGKLQLESISHIDVLKESGCPSCDLTKIVETSSNWNDTFRELNCDPTWFEDVVPKLAELCEELQECRVPVTLVHGDFFLNNCAEAVRDGERDLVIFDWEYAYIGHPFFDFHRIHKYVPEEVREEYLELWTEYEDIERLRRAYEAARDIGLAAKACLVLEWSKETMSRGSAQDPTDLGCVAFNFANGCDGMLYWRWEGLQKGKPEK